MAERLFCAPVAGLVPIGISEANALLERWGHYLGACNRPCGMEGWALDIDGRSISVAVSASIVSPYIAERFKDEQGRWQSRRLYDRMEVVELARLCSDPEERWATRPMLRLWREIAAPRWRYWRPRAAVAYSSTRRHQGDLYRWDGWDLLREDSRSGSGGHWSKARSHEESVETKRLWRWEYPPKPSLSAASSGV